MQKNDHYINFALLIEGAIPWLRWMILHSA